MLSAQESLRCGVILQLRPSEVLRRERIGAPLCVSASLRLCVQWAGGWLRTSAAGKGAAGCAPTSLSLCAPAFSPRAGGFALLSAQKSLRFGVILLLLPSEVFWREGIGYPLCASAPLRLCVQWAGGWLRTSAAGKGAAGCAPTSLSLRAPAFCPRAGGFASLLPLRLCVFPFCRCGYRTRWVAGEARATSLRPFAPLRSGREGGPPSPAG